MAVRLRLPNDVKITVASVYLPPEPDQPSSPPQETVPNRRKRPKPCRIRGLVMQWIRQEAAKSQASGAVLIIGGDFNACPSPLSDRPDGIPSPADRRLGEALSLPWASPSPLMVPVGTALPREASHVWDGPNKRSARIDDFLCNQDGALLFHRDPTTQCKVLLAFSHFSDHSPVLCSIPLRPLHTVTNYSIAKGCTLVNGHI